MNSTNNKYINTYLDNYVKPFRNYIKSEYLINIKGLANFISSDDHDVYFLTSKLLTHGFIVKISNGQDTIDEIHVKYTNKDNGTYEYFEYNIENLISTLDLSSKTGISIVGLLIMQIISKIICRNKPMYKAIILDLDDTIWKGTLSEDGFEIIKDNLCSSYNNPFIMFMRFIRALAHELGIYVAICSRNKIEDVLSAIDKLNDTNFPIKGHIDCIIANHNDKSINIKAIAQQLSILTNACVFIDDNQLVRNEVTQNLPEVFVPEWHNHEELLTLLLGCCIFDRFELSLKSRNRKRLYKILQQERENCFLPQLFIKVHNDIKHLESNRLYAKSNQFRFSEMKAISNNHRSLVYEIYRDNGESLGICSAITYKENKENIYILNWAISCRYFEIGLEEYILMHILTLSKEKSITFTFNDTGLNCKVIALINKYKNGFKHDKIKKEVHFNPNMQLINNIQHNTNLIDYCNE